MTEIKLIFFLSSCVVSFTQGVAFNKPVVTNKRKVNGRYHVTVEHYGLSIWLTKYKNT